MTFNSTTNYNQYLLQSPNVNHTFYFEPCIKATATLSMVETTTATTATLSAAPGTYYPGQSVPITAKFGFPMVISKDMTLTVNGQTLTPVEVGSTGEACTFLYPVQDVDGTTIALSGAIVEEGGTATVDDNTVKLSGTGANGRSVTVSLGSEGWQPGQTAPDVKLETPNPLAAFTSYTVEVQTGDANLPQAVVNVGLSDNEKATLWVINDLAENENKTTRFQAAVALEGKTAEEWEPFTPVKNESGTVTGLTATVPLEYNTTGSEQTVLVDFLLDSEGSGELAVMMGQCIGATVSASVPVASADIKPVLTVTPSGEGAQPATYRPGDSPPTLYAQQDNALTLSFTLAGNNYTWGDMKKVSYYDEDGQLADDTAHFAWQSSNPAVARVTVDSEGRASLTPTGQSGSVELTLVAINGSMDDATSAAIAVNFAVGWDPFLMIPSSGRSLTMRQGQDVTINWSSNLCQKNETGGADGGFAATTFHVSAYAGQEPAGKAFWTAELTTSDTERSISSATIPWKDLAAIYDEDERYFTVTVYAEYQGEKYGTYPKDDGTFGGNTATAVVKMISRPAAVVLDLPDGGLYQTDGGSGKKLTLTWQLNNFDTVGDGAGFELYVASTNKNFGTLTVDTVTEGLKEEYTLELPAVALDPNNPTSYRDSYTITVKAKNAADSQWSSSSYVLYVYSDSALRILVGGEEPGSSIKMSNVEEVAKLWGSGGDNGSAAIVALGRDIKLRDVISINYGEYSWAELDDQIKWSSSKSAVATVNYQQGTLYENIENFSYVSYRPTTEFVLSGLTTGTTTVTAEHARTGIKDSVDVEVETLRDKLYLFQCYPNNVATTLTYEEYTDNSKKTTTKKTVTSNDKGEAAIYAPYGIAGNVYCQSVVKQEDGTELTYLGTIYNSSLVSSETDSTKLQLYPVNTLQLRQAAYADIYLKKPDGTNYVGQVTVTGGVYRQGEYCDPENTAGVLLGLQGDKPSEGAGGETAQTVTLTADDKGHLRITMDLSQFRSESHTDDVQAGEKLWYIFQLLPGDGTSAQYQPILLRVDASLNSDDVTASGDKIVAWEENPNKTGSTYTAAPFVAMQTIQYSEKDTAARADVRRSTGNVGPSTTFPQAWMTTTVMWWGEDSAADSSRANTVRLRDTTGKEVPQQASQKITYPFSQYAFTENVVRLDQSGMTSWGVELYKKRSVNAELLPDGSNVSRSIALPFHIVNMIGAEKAEESKVLENTANDIKGSLNTNADMSNSDFLMGLGMSLLAQKGANYDSSQDTFAVRLYATSDPTVFRAFFCLNVGNMSSGGNVSGVYPNYTNSEEMGFAQTGSATEMGDLDVMPNLFNIIDMAKGNYMKNTQKEADKAYDGKRIRNFSFDVGGYFEADIVYNAEKGQWECLPVSGGFHGGAGVSFSWYVNTVLAIVPVNISLTLGATLELRMDMQRGNYYTVTGDSAVKELNDKITAVKNVEQALENAQTEEEKTALTAQLQELTKDFENTLATDIYTENYSSDYLTTLRIFLYARVFAGLGFDVSVLAFKVGLFGQLNVDLNFEWLNRSYLEEGGANFSAVGPVSSRTDSVIAGQEPRFSGTMGIEIVIKFLFITYEHVFCSVGFELDHNYNGGTTIDEIWAANQKINNEPVQRFSLPNGQTLYAVDLGPQLESRAYVDVQPQYWLGGMAVNAIDLDDASPLPGMLQTGAYPYADPVISDDGEMLLYLSDGTTEESRKDVTNTRVAFTKKAQGSFASAGDRFEGSTYDVADGYGDSGVKVAGADGSYAAAWVRQMENIVPESSSGTAGDALDEGQQMLQMNSTEIVAAIYENSIWTLTRLTENSTPDLAPVVATNGSRTIVAWREVHSSSVENLTSFDQQDVIRYAIHDKSTGWHREKSEGQDGTQTAANPIAVYTLYDGSGTGASVKGIEAAMLGDGTAAVVYTLDTDNSDSDDTDWETVAAIIPMDEETGAQAGEDAKSSEDKVRTFQLTTNDDLDENPQITTVTFGTGKEAVERFVIGWHTEKTVGETIAMNALTGEPATAPETQSDIRLTALDKDGVLYQNMPESVGLATEGTADAISSNFRFAKNADTIEDLAILWVDTIADSATDGDYYDKGTPVSDVVAATYGVDTGYDVLRAVKFVPDGSSYTVSGTVEVASMENADKKTINSFDAYMSDGGQVKSVLLATGYEGKMEREITITSGDGKTPQAATITTPVSVSGMYTATADFTNRIELSAVLPEYDNLYPNSQASVQFTIRNSGKEAITGLSITGKDGTSYYDTAGDPLYSGESAAPLNLLPNRDITVTARIPTGAAIENVDYTITATYAGGSSAGYADTLYLDIPDVGISKVETVKEADGERVLRYSLYNAFSSRLADENDGWQVKVGFYIDKDCTTPYEKDGKELVETISDLDNLALIDGGGYSAEVTIPVSQYVETGEEIPESGIPVFVKAWVEQDRNKSSATLSRARASADYQEVTEYFTANNETTLYLQNLAWRWGEDVTITSSLDNSGDGSKVTVNLQYNKLNGTQAGNLIVTLLDASGNPLEIQQYSTDGKAITLSKEKAGTYTFNFTKTGASVQVLFADQTLPAGETSTKLALVALTGAQVEYDGDKTYTATGANLTSGLLTLVPVDPNATIAVNGSPYDVESTEKISLPYGATRWTITVAVGEETDTYTLVLNNTNTSNRPSVTPGSSHTVTVAEGTEHGSVSVSPESAQAGSTVTITAAPDEGYQVLSVTVTDQNGKKVTVTDAGSGKYTFTMPDGPVTVAVVFACDGGDRCPSRHLTDITLNAWYHSAVDYVVLHGLMKGTSPTAFAPDRSLTRAEVAQILYNLERNPETAGETRFTDVKPGQWYLEAVLWAEQNQVVGGYGDGTFRPDRAVTREEFAQMMYNYAKYKGLDTSATADLSRFPDGNKVAEWAQPAMEWANANGLINGHDDGTLDPQGTTLRAQAAKILMVFHENLVK